MRACADSWRATRSWGSAWAFSHRIWRAFHSTEEWLRFHCWDSPSTGGKSCFCWAPFPPWLRYMDVRTPPSDAFALFDVPRALVAQVAWPSSGLADNGSCAVWWLEQMAGLAFCPESPVWLEWAGRAEDARKSEVQLWSWARVAGGDSSDAETSVLQPSPARNRSSEVRLGALHCSCLYRG
jgi:hypothetical protein